MTAFFPQVPEGMEALNQMHDFGTFSGAHTLHYNLRVIFTPLGVVISITSGVPWPSAFRQNAQSPQALAFLGPMASHAPSAFMKTA